MDHLGYIKGEIQKLLKSNPDIHISVNFTRLKVALEEAPVVITGAYRHVFQVEEKGSGRPVHHTFQYGDVLTGQVVIRELDVLPTVSVQNQK